MTETPTPDQPPDFELEDERADFPDPALDDTDDTDYRPLEDEDADPDED